MTFSIRDRMDLDDLKRKVDGIEARLKMIETAFVQLDDGDKLGTVLMKTVKLVELWYANEARSEAERKANAEKLGQY